MLVTDARPLHEVLAAALAPGGAGASPRLAEVVDAFLEYARAHNRPATVAQYAWYGAKLTAELGQVPSPELRPIDITRWVGRHGWSGSHEYNGRRYAFRFLAWAAEEGLIARNPLEGLKRPRPRGRRRALAHAEYLALVRATDSDFRPLLFALRQTGARPQELRDLRWHDVRRDHILLWDHKTDATRRPRVIHLGPVMQRFFQVLRRRRPHGAGDHVFLNSRGRPWTANAVRLRMKRLRDRAGLSADVCAYLLRHTFGTAAVMNGVDVATVSELLGHASTEITASVYVHLAGQVSHLQTAAAIAARPARRSA